MTKAVRSSKEGPMRVVVAGATVAVLALVIGMIGPAGADDEQEKLTLRFAEKAADDEQTSVFIDVGPKGVSEGDYFTFGDEPLYNRSLTKKVGHINGDCVLVDLTESAETYECDGSFYLPGGLITVEGSLIFTEQEIIGVDHAITGGTGKYETAHGVEEVSAGEKGLLFTFRVIL